MGIKYELTNETIYHYGRILHRIKALRDFSTIKKGEKGGFVEHKKNLSQTGNCWIHDDAKVFGNAMVYGNALVYDIAEVFGNAEVYQNAKIFDGAFIFSNTEVCGDAKIFGSAEVYGNAKVFGNAKIYDRALIHGYARVFDNAKVFGRARIFGNTHIYNSTEVCNVEIQGSADICGNAKIATNIDYIVFKNWWSSGRYFTWTRSNNMWRVGCFYGTGKELIAKAYKDSELSGREYKKVVDYVESILKDSKYE